MLPQVVKRDPTLREKDTNPATADFPTSLKNAEKLKRDLNFMTNLDEFRHFNIMKMLKVLLVDLFQKVNRV